MHFLFTGIMLSNLVLVLLHSQLVPYYYCCYCLFISLLQASVLSHLLVCDTHTVEPLEADPLLSPVLTTYHIHSFTPLMLASINHPSFLSFTSFLSHCSCHFFYELLYLLSHLATALFSFRASNLSPSPSYLLYAVHSPTSQLSPLSYPILLSSPTPSLYFHILCSYTLFFAILFPPLAQYSLRLS